MSSEKRLLAVATQSVDVFGKLHDGASVLCGSNTASVRASGIACDSVVIDCAKTQMRIGLVIMDSRPDEFAVAVVDRAKPDDVQHTIFPMNDLQAHMVLKFMDEHFAK